MIKEILKSHLAPRDEFLYGFAQLDGLTGEKYREFKFGISIGKKLDEKIVDKVINGPTLEYLEHYKNINRELEEIAEIVSQSLTEKNINNIVLKPTISSKELDTKYNKTLRTDISHKMVATRAGLGWIGKTGLLVTRIFGPRIRFVTILTDYKLEPESKPYDMSECGECRICVQKCPANAANGKPWNILVDRDKFLDAQKCREQCRIFGEEILKVNQRICGICVAVCPLGIKKMAGG